MLNFLIFFTISKCLCYAFFYDFTCISNQPIVVNSITTNIWFVCYWQFSFDWLNDWLADLVRKPVTKIFTTHLQSDLYFFAFTLYSSSSLFHILNSFFFVLHYFHLGCKKFMVSFANNKNKEKCKQTNIEQITMKIKFSSWVVVAISECD